ncbi:MAG: hypothetical protein IKH04_00870 [Kiritimatiellae bacterium]|nr:hypothetical protein [Kiritimatiellia bacterium]
MPRIVTSRKAARRGRNSSDGTVRALAIAVVALCGAFLCHRHFRWHGQVDSADTTPPPTPGLAAAAPARTSGTGPAAGEAPVEGTATPPNAGAAGGGASAAAANAPDRNGKSAGEKAGGGIAHPSATESPAPLQPRMERQFFDNDVENTLAVISRPGVNFFDNPPRVEMTMDEVVAFLRRPVEIGEDDDEEAIAAKERTADFKSRALKAIEEDGLTFDQFVRDVVAVRREQYEMREDARLEMVRLLEEEGEGAAREYLNSVNDALREQGLDEIVMPRHLIERLAR